MSFKLKLSRKFPKWILLIFLLPVVGWLMKSREAVLSAAAQHLFTPKTLVEGMAGQPHLINPLYADLNPVDKVLNTLFYRGLIKYNQAGLPEGDLAEKWEISPDQKSYQVTLKNDVYFSDGKKLTAEDVVFTYHLTQLPEYQGPKKGFFEGVKVVSQGESTVSFTLKQPLSSFLESLSLGILPRHIWQGLSIKQILQSEHNLLPVGTGGVSVRKKDLKINTRHQIEKITLRLNSGRLKKLQFKFYPDEESLATAFKLGEIDSFVLKDSKHYPELTHWPGLKQIKRELQERQYLVLFNDDPPAELSPAVLRLLKNPNLRKAMRALTKKVLGDDNNLGPLPKASWAYQVSRTDDVFKKLEVEEEMALTLSLPKKPYFLQLAQTLQKAAHQAGLELKLEPLESKDFREKALEKRDFQMLLLARSIGVDPDQYIYWHSSQRNLPGLNLASFSNRRVDKALEEGRKKFNLDERKRYYREFQAEIAREVPALFLTPAKIVYFLPAKLSSPVPDVWWQEGDRFRNIQQWVFD